MSENTNPPPGKGSAINIFFLFFIAGAIVFAAYTGRMREITEASFESAKGAVTLAIGLIGIMALWLGLVRVLEAGGLTLAIARLLKPLMVRLFPDVPPEHPSMSAMILNISANMLGLGNAATPFGIKAMMELDKLNPIKGTATNAMCLFLALNTSSVALLPLGVIGVRAAAGSADPVGIFIPTLLATLCSTLVGAAVAIGFARRDHAWNNLVHAKESERIRPESASTENPHLEDLSHLRASQRPGAKLVACLLPVALLVALIWRGTESDSLLAFAKDEVASWWLMPALMLFIASYGMARGVKVYEAVTEGAKQGFEIAIRIIPFLVAILVAIGMFRASGAMDVLARLIAPITSLIGLSPEVLPMALLRPLSGSGAFGVMSSLINTDPNSYDAFLSSVMMGSTETTFYVLAVYFGAVGITRIRHALVAAICADITGIFASCVFSGMFFSAV